MKVILLKFKMFYAYQIHDSGLIDDRADINWLPIPGNQFINVMKIRSNTGISLWKLLAWDFFSYILLRINDFFDD